MNSHNWIFHPNEYTGLWHAVKREDYNLLFNDSSNSKILTSKNVNSLVELIDKTDGDDELIKKLTNG